MDELLKDYYETKSPLVREKIILNSLDLVKKYISKRKDHINDMINSYLHGISAEDIEQYAYEGLINAVDTYNPDIAKKHSFNIYVTMCINNMLKKRLHDEGMLMYVSNIESIMEYFKAVKKFQKDTGRMPSEEELAEKLGISLKQIREIEFKINMLSPESYEKLSITSFENEAGHNAEKIYPEDIYYNIEEDPLFDLAVNEEIRGKLLTAVENIKKPMRKEAIILRFGLDGENPKSMPEIAEYLGVTPERVRQILQKACIDIRHNLNGELYDLISWDIYYDKYDIYHVREWILRHIDYIDNGLEKTVLTVRYGLKDGIIKTLSETSRILRLSDFQVYKICDSGLENLKRTVRKR